MIGLLEMVGMAVAITICAFLAILVAVLVGTALMGLIFDCTRWAHERHEALREERAEIRRDRVRQSSLREQLATAQAEVQQLEYENQNLRRARAAAGETLPEPDKSLSVLRGHEPRVVHGVVEERRR